MKNFIKSLILGIVLIISTSLAVKADTNISLKRIHTSADSVEVSIDNVSTIVNSFQVSLKLEGNVKLKDIVWSKSLSKTAKTSYKYNADNNILNIYVTSKENLVSKNGEIVIGTLKVEGPKKGTFNIVSNSEKANGALKLVSNKYKETIISEMAISGEDEFVFPGDTPVIDSDKSETNTPEGSEKPSDSNKPGNNTSEEIKNPIASNKPVINTDNNTEMNLGTSSMDNSIYNEVIDNTDPSDEKDHVLNDSNDFEDVENEVLSQDDEKHNNQVNDKADLNKKESKSNNFMIYIGGAIITLIIGIGIYIKFK